MHLFIENGRRTTRGDEFIIPLPQLTLSGSQPDWHVTILLTVSYPTPGPTDQDESLHTTYRLGDEPYTAINSSIEELNEREGSYTAE